MRSYRAESAIFIVFAHLGTLLTARANTALTATASASSAPIVDVVVALRGPHGPLRHGALLPPPRDRPPSARWGCTAGHITTRAAGRRQL